MVACVPSSSPSLILIEPTSALAGLRSYRVELPPDLLDEQGNTLEWLIGFAFDTLDARLLDLRIIASPSGSPQCF